MMAKYFWDLEIADIKKDITEQNIIDFFLENKSKAKKLINHINRENFMDTIACLNVIDEKMRLLFFFLNLLEQENYKEEEIVKLVESDLYISLENNSSKVKDEKILRSSLLYILDKYDNQPIWNIDFIHEIASRLNIESIKVLSQYNLIIYYYCDLEIKGNKLLSKISGENFNSIMPSLISISEKCSMVLEMAVGHKFFLQSAYAWLEMVENDFLDYHFEKWKDEVIESYPYSMKIQIGQDY